MDVHSKALNSMFDDMDDMESKKMFGEPDGDEAKGVSITISVTPQGDVSMPDHEEGMCKGGCAYHTGGTVPKPEMESDIFSGYDKGEDPEYKKGEMGMNKGGVAEPTSENDLSLPPFLRKKKKG